MHGGDLHELPRLPGAAHGPATAIGVFEAGADYLSAGLTPASRHYGEHAEMEERTCMPSGDLACTFDVTFSAGSSSA